MSSFSQPDRSPGSPTLSAVMAGLMIFVPIPGIRGGLFGLFSVIAQRAWSDLLRTFLLGVAMDLIVSFTTAFVCGMVTDGYIKNLVLNVFQFFCVGYGSHSGAFLPMSPTFFCCATWAWVLSLFVLWMITWPAPKRAQQPAGLELTATACAAAIPLLLLAVDAVDQYVYVRWYRPDPVGVAAVPLAPAYQAAVALPCALFGYVLARSRALDADDNRAGT